jgi:hypothetical protein
VNSIFPKSNACGVLAVLEPQASLSPHIHAIVYGPYIPQKVLIDAWLALTGDSYIVDIRQIRSVCDALEYVFKYVSKPPSNLKNADDVAVYVAITRGFRRLHSYGIWYNIGKIDRKPVGCPHVRSQLPSIVSTTVSTTDRFRSVCFNDVAYRWFADLPLPGRESPSEILRELS